MLPRLKVVSIIKLLSSGRTKPCLVLAQDEDGVECEVVVKWRSGPETKDTGGICELISSLLADDFDLPAPKAMLVDVEPDFHRAVPWPEIAKLVKASAGPNFATKFLPSMTTWPTGRPVASSLRTRASEIFAFDALIENPDRRINKPNILWSGEDLCLCDHEQAFSFLHGVIGWRPAWSGQGLEFLRNHVFYVQLKGQICDWSRLSGALEAMNDKRLIDYATAVPDEWKTGNDATDRILGYLKGARQNKAALFAAIDQILK
ncbi:MAG TPA: HipA family kinase [Verrucomicrobiae bacterium]|nr:HipA family kinase [Verrucomicrobiae bacterium]